MERKPWAVLISIQLNAVADLQKDQFILLAGQSYIKPLRPYLAHIEEPLKGQKFGVRASLKGRRGRPAVAHSKKIRGTLCRSLKVGRHKLSTRKDIHLTMNTKPEFDTRKFLVHMIDYPFVFPGSAEQNMEDAAQLIKDIPSLSLVLLVANINHELYLHDSGKTGLAMQCNLVKRLHPYDGPLVRIIIAKFQEIEQYRQWPALFYRLSNLLFYELIFTHYENSVPPRDLTYEDMQSFLKAYLIVNNIINRRIQLPERELETADSTEKLYEALLPQFIYQKDYVSNNDYNNQVIRCDLFFKYLETSETFKKYLPGYYSVLKVKNSFDLLHKLMVAMYGFFGNGEKKSLTIKLEENTSDLDRAFFDQLSFIEDSIIYTPDIDFKDIRNKMLFKSGDYPYLILDLSFLIDQFYKAQVFAFNDYLKGHGIKDFLGKKGKEFTEEQYLPFVMENCFPSYTHVKAKESLGDYHIINAGNLMLAEFKDMLMSSKAKHCHDAKLFFKELDKKIKENEKGAPKGITQLANAIKEISSSQNKPQQIYPVLIYTDNAYNFDGTNRKYIPEFRELIKDIPGQDTVNDITFINLSFFENCPTWLQGGTLDIFELIRQYHVHISNVLFSDTPFEVFAMPYMKQSMHASVHPGFIKVKDKVLQYMMNI